MPPSLLLLLLAALIVIPIPGIALPGNYPLYSNVLENIAHPVIFALICAIALRAARRYCSTARWQPASAYGIAALIALFLALATEGIQILQARDASLEDLLNDMLGAGAALFFQARHDFAFTRWGLRWRLIPGSIMAALCVAIVAWPFSVATVAYVHRQQAFPVLWRSDSALDQNFSNDNGPEFPGLNIEEISSDWRGYDELQIRLHNLSPVAVDVFVRVHDRLHDNLPDDRYNEQFLLPAASQQTLRIPIRRIQNAPTRRQLDLRAMRGIIVFRGKTDSSHIILVNELRLVKLPQPPETDNVAAIFQSGVNDARLIKILSISPIP
jgi:hypothetical protein